MKIFLNCAKPTMFKGNEQPAKAQPAATTAPAVPVETKVAAKPASTTTTTQPQIQPQLKKDTVEISTKKPEAKCEGPACKK